MEHNRLMHLYHADMWRYYKRLPVSWGKNMAKEARHHEEMAINYLCELEVLEIHRKFGRE